MAAGNGKKSDEPNGQITFPVTYTETERKILEVLADGMPHHRDHLRDCLPDELSGFNSLAVHLHRIRAKLKLRQRGILCELRGRAIMYRQVILLNPNNDE